MVEFYTWASNNFLDFVVVTFVLVMALEAIITVVRRKE